MVYCSNNSPNVQTPPTTTTTTTTITAAAVQMELRQDIEALERLGCEQYETTAKESADKTIHLENELQVLHNDAESLREQSAAKDLMLSDSNTQLQSQVTSAGFLEAEENERDNQPSMTKSLAIAVTSSDIAPSQQVSDIHVWLFTI